MKFESRKLTLTISILCSTRDFDTLKKCLNSLDSLRKKTKSELIITDTGMSPECRDFAKSKADKYLTYEWNNDFSEARNYGLHKAEGEWFLFLDDDEWFENTKELEIFFGTDEWEDYGSLQYFQRNYFDFDGNAYHDTYTSRCARLVPGTHFHGRIHEIIEPIYKPLKVVNDYVHHYGYLYKSAEKQIVKLRRNTTLLRKMMEEEPNNTRWPEHYANEMLGRKEYLSLHDFCVNIINRYITLKDKNHQLSCNLFYCAMILASIGIEDYNGAENELKQALSRPNLKIFTEAKLYYLGGIIYFEKEKHKLSLSYINKYNDKLKEYKKLSPEEQSEISFFTNDITYNYLFNSAFSIAAADALIINDMPEYHKFIKMIDWNCTPSYFYPDTLPKELTKAISEDRIESSFKEDIVRVSKSAEIDLANAIKELEKKDHYGTGLRKIFSMLAPYANNDPFFTYIYARNLYMNESSASEREKSDVLSNFFKSEPNFLLTDETIYVDAANAGVDVGKVFESIYFPKFQYAVDCMCNSYKAKAETKEDKEWHEKLTKRFALFEGYFGQSRSRHHCYFKIMAMLSHMAVDTEGIKPDTVKAYFYEYWNTCLFYADGIYALDAVTPENEAFDHLPDFLQAGIFLYHSSLDEKEGKEEEYKRDILKACDHRVELKKWAEILVGKDEDALRDKDFEEDVKEGNVGFDEFVDKLISDSKYLISQGQISEAKRNLTGLLAIKPGDERITELLKAL